MSTEKIEFNLDAVCPFCGLLCDDVSVNPDSEEISVNASGCHIADARYSQACKPIATAATHKRKRVEYEFAIRTAAKLISNSKLPVIAGMMTDVAGTRAALKLADRTRAIINHHADQTYGLNASRIQTYGGYFTTLTEIKNRADLIVIFGSSPVSEFPRFLETILSGSPNFVDERTIAFIGNCGIKLEKYPIECLAFDCEPDQVGMIADAIRLRIDDSRNCIPDLGFMANESIEKLVQMINKADYPVLVWSASDFAFPLGDLAVDSIIRLIDSLNITQRCAGLVMTPSPSTVTVSQVATWQYGKPTPLSFRSGAPEYHPEFFSLDSVVERGDVDLLLWVGGLEKEFEFPETRAFKLAISNTNPNNSDLFIPVGVPGVHHDAHLFRTDNVVAMHLRQLKDESVPSSAQVLDSILNELDDRKC